MNENTSVQDVKKPQRSRSDVLETLAIKLAPYMDVESKEEKHLVLCAGGGGYGDFEELKGYLSRKGLEEANYIVKSVVQSPEPNQYNVREVITPMDEVLPPEKVRIKNIFIIESTIRSAKGWAGALGYGLKVGNKLGISGNVYSVTTFDGLGVSSIYGEAEFDEKHPYVAPRLGLRWYFLDYYSKLVEELTEEILVKLIGEPITPSININGQPTSSSSEDELSRIYKSSNSD